jgi:N-methylhydantoinase A
MADWQIGVDVGGTFTDVVAVGPALGIFRVASLYPPRPTEAIAFVHGTTVGTNAVLERKGAACRLVTTQCFRDTLELGRRTRPTPYGMIGTFEPPISPRASH